MEVEITDIPPLSPGETSLLNLHSVLNVLNVLHGELVVLGLTLANDAELLRPALTLCEHIQADLVDPAASLRHAAELPETIAAIDRMITHVLTCNPSKAHTPEVQDSLANIRSVFDIFLVRAREILARAQAPGRWVDVPIDELRAEFRAVFAAIEKNSHGRYRIIYNLARQEPADYYVDFVIESQDQRTIALPPVFKDVMRDLMANARKYTPLGGTISAGLYETADQLKFTVQDTGRGIPPGELQTVVHYGKRGSNVGEVRTMGGGFGLTKAFLVTKQFGGRFWIRSELGAGTRIRIEIPRPARTPAGVAP
ncbi:MAG: ATP-binding protein [Opitutae bacterium]|nr:ATP-binding protein [Opitutae bacterium]